MTLGKHLIFLSWAVISWVYKNLYWVYTLKTSTMTIKRAFNILNLKGTVSPELWAWLQYSNSWSLRISKHSLVIPFSFQSFTLFLTLLHWALKDHDFSRVQENSSTYEKNGVEPWKPKGAGKTATTVNCLTHLSFGLHWLPFPSLDM